MSSPRPIEIVVRKPQLFKRHYEFWQHNNEVAVLDYPNGWTKHSNIRVNDQHWKLRTTGFWSTTLELTAQQSPYTKLEVPLEWNYKLTISPNTRDTYKILSKGFWKRRWVVEDAHKNEVIEMTSNAFSSKNRGTILVHQPITNELLLLAVFGWYVAMSYEEATAAAAV